jgi:4-aminobutyrate aminotransferase
MKRFTILYRLYFIVILNQSFSNTTTTETDGWIQRDANSISPSYTRDFPLVVSHAQGMFLYTPEGKEYLDFGAGLAVCSTGHRHPLVQAAIEAQLNKVWHISSSDYYEPTMITLAETLKRLTPWMGEAATVYFGNSGAEATEAALKLVRFNTQRPAVVSFERGFHGRTFGAMSLTASKGVYHQGFAPLVPQVFHAPYPYPYRSKIEQGICPETDALQCLTYLEETFFQQVISPTQVAAFVVEAIQGEGGYIVPPDSFLLGLQRLAKQHGILLVCDEVQSGIGRTGKLWASQHITGFEPDVLLTAKGLASGLPLSAVIAKAGIMNWAVGSHASTFGGNPLACASAIATLELVEKNLTHNAHIVGETYLKSELQQLQQQYPQHIGEARGRGLMLAIELVEQGTLPSPKKQNTILNALFNAGIVVVGCGYNSIRFCPPLIVEEHHCQQLITTLKAILHQLSD